MINKKTLLSASIAAVICTSPVVASASVVHLDFSGLFTLLDPTYGVAVQNTSYPYYGDPTWGYGRRTQISGTMTYDTSTGAGTGTMSSFAWMNGTQWVSHDINLHNIGGGLVIGTMLYDAYGITNIPVETVWDASGFLGAGPYSVGQTISGVGAVPASDGINSGNYPIGPVPFATTTYNTDGGSITSDDGIGGSPLTGGPFSGYNPNIDLTSMTVTSVSSVPIPAAVWLFGSGLLGLIGVGRRRQSS